MKRILKYVGIALASVVALVIGLGFYVFAGGGSIKDGQELEGFARTVKDGYVSVFVLDAGGGKVALIDAGNDPKGVAIGKELARRGLGPSAVSVIFFTHGHPDHIAAAALFPAAQLYALETERALVAGAVASKGPVPRLFGAHPTGLTLTRGLRDGEIVVVGDLRVQAFAVPGHTAGSAAYLVNGVLFLGDSADATGDGHLVGAKGIFSDDVDENRASLKALAARLPPADVKQLAFAHTGVLSGFAPLADFAAAAR